MTHFLPLFHKYRRRTASGRVFHTVEKKFPHGGKIGLALLLAACAVPAAAFPADWFAEPRHRLNVSIGSAEIFDSDPEFCWGIEYVPAWRFFHVAPWICAETGKNNEFYSSVGILLEVNLTHGWVLLPSFGGGYYSANNGLDLGFDVQFRSSLALEREFGRGHRLGISFTHISNGSLSDINPGTEILAAAYSLPLDLVFDWFRRPGGAS
ncbi:MAG: acyloxyacyl hydrolase [Verrucomicrobiota bacterium]|jgi:hypothetical protein|nr:acyloxyacyl hydrolase [Verrucomicrobiota bacterium]